MKGIIINMNKYYHSTQPPNGANGAETNQPGAVTPDEKPPDSLRSEDADATPSNHARSQLRMLLGAHSPLPLLDFGIAIPEAKEYCYLMQSPDDSEATQLGAIITDEEPCPEDNFRRLSTQTFIFLLFKNKMHIDIFQESMSMLCGEYSPETNTFAVQEVFKVTSQNGKPFWDRLDITDKPTLTVAVDVPPLKLIRSPLHKIIRGSSGLIDLGIPVPIEGLL
jgi:hypothetical protein